jgi:hypothetical protein
MMSITIPTGDPRISGSEFMPELRNTFEQIKATFIAPHYLLLDSVNTSIPAITAADTGLSITNTNTTPGNLAVISFRNAALADQAQIGVVNIGPGATDGGRLFITTRKAGEAAPAERMTIAANGFVGFGTDAPAQPVHLKTTSATQPSVFYAESTHPDMLALFSCHSIESGVDISGMSIRSNGSNYASLRWGLPDLKGWNETLARKGNGLVVGIEVDKPLIFAQNNLERVRIYNNRIGFGTTSPIVPYQFQSVSGAIAGLQINNSDFLNGSVGSSLYLGLGALSGSTFAELQAFMSGGTAQGNLVINRFGGNVGIGVDPGGKFEVRGGTSLFSTTGLAHGMTTLAPTTSYGSIQQVGAAGGLFVSGLRSDALGPAVQIFGVSDGNITSAFNAHVMLQGAIRSGTGRVAAGSSSKILTVLNLATELFTILGNGRVGVGTTAPFLPFQLQSPSGSTVGMQLNNSDFALGTVGSSLYFGLGASSGTTWAEIQPFTNGDAAGGTLILSRRTDSSVSVGTTLSSAKMHVLSTTEQIRIGFDPSNYSSFTVSAGGNLTITTTGDFVFDTVGKDVLPSLNYDLNLGAANKKFLTIHGAELRVETLTAAETITMINGRVVIGVNATMLIADLAPGSNTIDVKHSGLANGVRIWLEDIGQVEWMAVTSGPTTITGGFRYSVTRDLDGSGANQWYAGDSVVNTGTTGSGFIEMYSTRGIKSGSQVGPTILGSIRNSGTYNDLSEVWAIGNLDGTYGYGVTTFGAAFGKYAAGTAHITIDSTNGYRTFAGLSTVVQQIDNSGNLTIGEVGANKANVLISSGSFKIRLDTTARIQLLSDGSGFLANSLIAWDTAGNLTISGNASIASWTVNSAYLAKDTGTNATSSGMAPTDFPFFAGATYANRATAPFRITPAGALTATSATISGTITATSGAITGTLEMSGASSAISIGTIPPTSASFGTGIWIDRTGLYALNGGLLNAKIGADGSVIQFTRAQAILDVISLEATGKASQTNGTVALIANAFTGSNSVYFKITADSTAPTIYAALQAASGTLLGLLIGPGTFPTAMLDVTSDTIRLRTSKTPASASAAGNAGDHCWDSSFFYICVATNAWKRAAIATW